MALSAPSGDSLVMTATSHNVCPWPSAQVVFVIFRAFRWPSVYSPSPHALFALQRNTTHCGIPVVIAINLTAALPSWRSLCSLSTSCLWESRASCNCFSSWSTLLSSITVCVCVCVCSYYTFLISSGNSQWIIFQHAMQLQFQLLTVECLPLKPH